MAHLISSAWTVSTFGDVNRFMQVRPDVYRCTFGWKMLAGVPMIPVCTFLIKLSEAHSWALIDAGFPDPGARLVGAIREHIGAGGVLTRILITHGHLDHTAAIPQLLDLYPDCQVSCHPAEYKFLVEGVKYRECETDNLTFRVCRHLLRESQVRVPADRVITVADGEILFGALVKALHVPGHTPGSMAYLHIPSSSLMVGDLFMNLPPGFGTLGTRPRISGPWKLSTCSCSAAARAMVKTLECEFDAVYPAHDAGDGIDFDLVADYLGHSA